MRFVISILSLMMVSSAFASGASRSVELSDAASDVRLVDAQYVLIPTKTEQRAIPGCRNNGEASLVCEETIVLESKPMIKVYLSYDDSRFRSDSNEPFFTSLLFETTDFTPAQVAKLESVYPAWKHPFSNENRKFARHHLSLDVKTVKQTISIVDTKRSKLCLPHGESNEPLPGCVEKIVYKDSWRRVVVATVTVK